LPADRLAGLALSGAMHSVLLVNTLGQPLAPAPTWADQRAAPQAAALRKRADSQALYQRTGCPLVSSYHLAKLRWWLEEQPALARRAARFVSLKDYVFWRLTGRWATDIGLASTTGLLDIRRFIWDSEALGLAGIGAERLPALVRPAVISGSVTAEASKLTGLPVGLPVAAGSSDGGAANLGAGAVHSGQSVVTMGTSGAVRRLVSESLLDPLARTWCYVLDEGQWFAGGAINNAGLAIQWVRDSLYPDVAGDAGYAALMADAAAVAPGAEGVRMLPYFSGERSPHWDPDARASLTGLSLAHTRAHIARAALEGVAYCLADVWDVLNAGAPPAGLVRLTGNVTHSPMWAQIVADVLGVEMLADEAADASALGAALLGQRALGWAAQPEAEPQGQRYAPDTGRHAFYHGEHRVFQALYRSLVEARAENKQ
jgi:gluconokinase